MEIIHITPTTNGYEIVKLLANNISRKNHMAMIEKDGKLFMTGGFLINNTSEIREVLDMIPADKQYDFVRSFKMNPFVKFYYEEDENE